MDNSTTEEKKYQDRERNKESRSIYFSPDEDISRLGG
jgi:hypothetical protein